MTELAKLWPVVLLCALLSTAEHARSTSSTSANQSKIDTYVDAIIDGANKLVVENKCDPLPIKNFTFKISKTGISNRDVKANITLGRFEGLSKLHRRKPCHFLLPAPTPGRADLAPPANLTITCNVTVSGVKATIINGQFKGDTLVGTVKEFSSLTNVDTADLSVTFVGRPGLRGQLSSAALDSAVLTTTFLDASHRPDLNKERLSNFTDELNRRLGVQLIDFVSSQYRSFLDSATSKKIIPYLV